MSTNRSIFTALDTRMAAFVPVTPTAWPNATFTPPAVPWLKVSHLPARPVRRSLGVDGQNAYPGIYQVMVNVPAGAGPGDGESMSDLVANHFPLGAVYGGVRIVAVGCSPAISGPDWYSIPVSITYELVTSA